MRPVRTLIVDDEPLARRAIRLLLSRDRDVEVVAECRNGVEAVKLITAERPDLVFLDVQMPQMSGFDVIRAVGVENMPVAVFVTAFDRYAVKAFEMQALDYLLKPFEDSRFEQTLRRVKTQLARRGEGSWAGQMAALLSQSPDRSSRKYSPRLIINANGKLVFLDPDGVDWITAADYYVQIHSRKKTYLHRQTMEQIERELDPEKFVRIHRSAIVNIDRVKELRPTRSGDHVVVLDDGTELKMSRRRRDRLRKLL